MYIVNEAQVERTEDGELITFCIQFTASATCPSTGEQFACMAQ